MARKSTKADMIAKMLTEGFTAPQIKKRMKVSESYVYAIKKELAEKTPVENDDDVVRPRLVGPHEVKRVTKAEAEAIKAKAKLEVEAKANEVENVLDARADQYGSFMQSAEVAIKIKSIMHNSIARKDMHLFPDQMLALDMIAVKLSRIVGGNPAHRDSWLDIAGYAKLVADRLGGVSR
jgi:hypothetical protein